MADLTVSALPGRTGLDVTAAALVAATSGGDDFVSTTGTELVVINNGDASPHTVTFTIQTSVDGVTPAGKAVTVPAGKTYIIGPFPQSIYQNKTTGKVAWTYDAVTSVKVGVFKGA